jgi:hypothetical protein
MEFKLSKFDLIPDRIKVYFIYLLAIIFSGCSYKITKNYKAPTNSIVEESASPLIVKMKDITGINSEYLGSIMLNDAGFTIKCSESHAMEILNAEAKKLNANLVNIKVEYTRDISSSCYRCYADFHKAFLDDRLQEILKKTTRSKSYYDTLNNLKWSDILLATNDSYLKPYTFFSNLEVNSSGVKYQNKKFTGFKVNSFFYDDVSFVSQSFINDSNLVHLRLLYDISQIYAKRLENYLNYENIRSDSPFLIDFIKNKFLQDLYTSEELYISETDFGRNLNKQAIWSAKIKAALAEMKLQ